MEQAEEVFEALKTTMTNTLMLALPKFSLPFKLECDTSGNRIEAILMQRGKPIAFANSVISKHAKSLSTNENELIVIVEVICKCRPYLLESRITINANHSRLKYLLKQQITTVVQMKWLTKLMRIDYVVI